MSAARSRKSPAQAAHDRALRHLMVAQEDVGFAIKSFTERLNRIDTLDWIRLAKRKLDKAEEAIRASLPWA